MLIRMLYVSTAVGPITTTVTGTILRSAQAWNNDHGITGVLCQGQGVYLQVLEGKRAEVNSLYTRITEDRRHKNVQLMAFEDITHRRYGAWAMAHVDLTEADSVLALKDSDTDAQFDPYIATSERVMARIDALIAAGKVMGAPVVG
jgi:Sensors of blue-light using FAD